MYGLPDQLIQQIIEVADRFGVHKLVLFGSRARGSYRPASNIDLAVYGLDTSAQLSLRAQMEELDTLLKFDLVPIQQETDRVLMAEIERDGVVLMEKRITKKDQFVKALERTCEAIREYRQTNSQVVRDGVIQRFEFTSELAWKSCCEYLLEEGYVGIDSPKSTMRQAFSSGIIDDEQGWLSLLQARSLTSHMYSEQQAQEIYTQIEKTFVPLFEKLAAALKI